MGTFTCDQLDRAVPVLDIAPLRSTLIDPQEIGSCPDEILVLRVDRHEESSSQWRRLRILGGVDLNRFAEVGPRPTHCI